MENVGAKSCMVYRGVIFTSDAAAVIIYTICIVFFFFKQKTAYEMRISDWSSDVCSSDLTCQFAIAKMTSTAVSDTQMIVRRIPTSSCSSVEIGRASCRERVCQYV